VKGGVVKQITFDHKGIEDIAILNDNQTIFYISYVQGVPKLFTVNINKLSAIKQVAWSNDKYIRELYHESDGNLYVRYDQGDLRSKYASINEMEKLTNILNDEPINYVPVKSKDGSKLVYNLIDFSKWIYTLRIKDTKSNKNSDIFLSTNYIGGIKLDKEEKNIFMTVDNNIFIVNLFADQNPKDDNWDKILHENTSKSKQTNQQWDLTDENFPFRKKQLTNEGNWSTSLYVSPDSTLYYFSNNSLKKVKFDGKDKEEVFNFRTQVTIVHMTDNFSHLYYIQNNKLHKLDVKAKKSDQLKFEYNYSYNREVLNKNIFEIVWGSFGHNFYDPKMHGQDWNEIYQKFTPYTTDIRSTTTLHIIVDEMIGKVNASHTGFNPRSDINRHYFDRAYIGATFDYKSRLANGIRLKDVYHGSELADKYKIKAGDVLLEVNGITIKPETEIDPLFTNKQNKELQLRIQSPKGIVTAKITGLTWWEQHQMRYEDNVQNNYNTVQKASNGKLGYLHIQRMNQSALRKFRQDFLALNVSTQGLIIDVRGNGGGRISGELLDTITSTQRAWTYFRYHNIKPNLHPNNIYQGPIVCLVDEDSYSDAEIFGTLFKDMEIGHVIGMPSSGSVIGTIDYTLMDGSILRMPSSGWFRMNMENMELTGAKPDILVPKLPEHFVKKQDPQLEKAIEVLSGIMN